MGVGGRLVAPGLARADAEGMACYLTTARGENVGFYRRFGFQVEAEGLPLVPGGPTHWAMRRPPARR
jgi:predicted N-acetyltransferase YhbS